MNNLFVGGTTNYWTVFVGGGFDIGGSYELVFVDASCGRVVGRVAVVVSAGICGEQYVLLQFVVDCGVLSDGGVLMASLVESGVVDGVVFWRGECLAINV